MIDETDENEISEDSWKVKESLIFSSNFSYLRAPSYHQFHLFENQDEIIEKERKFREEQKRLDSLLLQYLSVSYLQTL